MTYEDKRKNITMTTSDSYEIKIGNTVYVISHEYGTADMFDIAADYLSDKSLSETKKFA